jgi:hypothetical protein
MMYKLYPNRIQPKLRIGQSGDTYEKEADAMADRVMRMSDNSSQQMQADVNAPQISMKCAQCNDEDHIQMQSEEGESAMKMQVAQIKDPIVQKEDEEEDTSISPDAAVSVPGICSLNPVYPDFHCFLIHLKRNVDTNLYNNAHHFMRIASLYPDDSRMMEDAFLRYGLGVNILETSYQFLGANAGVATGLAYGTGIGLKALDFFSKGELMLDFQIELTDNVNLDLRLDLNANPDNLLDIRGASAGIGVSGHF